jgi:hypothetical protein
MVANIDDFTILVRCGAVQSAIETAPCRSPTLLTAVFRLKRSKLKMLCMMFEAGGRAIELPRGSLSLSFFRSDLPGG